MSVKIVHGDCVEVMRTWKADHFDAVVCDPPYGLEFMGKEWDRLEDPALKRRGQNASDAANRGYNESAMVKAPGFDHSIESRRAAQEWHLTWAREAFRVLKPGGHLLAFGGTRTYHRLACAIEDAGFEIRDCVMWLYGSGFPKSLDVAKAIDRRQAGNDLIRPWLRSLGTREELAAAAQVTVRQIDHYLGDDTPCPQTLTSERFSLLCKHFNTMPEWAEAMYPKLGEQVGMVVHSRSGGVDFAKRPGSVGASRTLPIYDSATDAAKKWQGWGTALKPAHEPVVVARKPLAGTVASNVQKYGTGAINIDGCRVETTDNLNGGAYAEIGNRSMSPSVKPGAGSIGDAGAVTGREFKQPLGRWPANVVHDGSDEVLAAFPDAPGQLSDSIEDGAPQDNKVYSAMKRGGPHHTPRTEESKSAARFFYCAKTSRKERGEGNNHPTVKPIALMRYLVRLVTPPGGKILDPFLGSGSTGLAAVAEGVRFVGIEREAAYVKIAETRLRAVAPDLILKEFGCSPS